MLGIQEAGTQILGNNPNSFYIFAGEELGVKQRYLQHLHKYYGATAIYDSVTDVLDYMRVKHFIPLKPQLYVVRYDESFLSLKDNADLITKSKIIGTLVCIYETEKQYKRCEKSLGEYTVRFDKLNKAFIAKYLAQDFPQMSSFIIDQLLKLTDDYMTAYNMCLELSYLGESRRLSLTYNDIQNTFGGQTTTADQQFQIAFASKNTASCLHILDNYQGEIDKLTYIMLSTTLDLESSLISKRKNAVSKYVSSWDYQSIYNMFSHIYDELSKSRSVSPYNIYDRLVYLISLLQYQSIPQLGVI